MRAACLVRTAIKQCQCQELEDKEAREQATHGEHRTREPLDERSTRPEDDLDKQALSSSRMKTLIPPPSPATSCAQSKVSGSWDEKTMIDDHLDWNRPWSTNANKYRHGLRQRLDLAGERWGRGRSSASLELPIRTGIWGAHDTKSAFRKKESFGVKLSAYSAGAVEFALNSRESRFGHRKIINPQFTPLGWRKASNLNRVRFRRMSIARGPRLSNQKASW